MTLKEALRRARELLAASHVAERTLESEILLRHVIKSDRVQLYQDLNRELTPAQEQSFWHFINRYLKGEPIAYITGHKEFYSLDFCVDRRVLVPRPETETLVEKAIELARRYHIISCADVGTGCGAIAVSLAVHLPEVTIYATDSSADALAVARINCERHGVAGRIRLLAGNLLEPLPEPVDLITANLPYVKTAEIPEKGPLSYEPKAALDGGADGLDEIRRFCPQVKDKLRPRGYVLMEIGLGQSGAVTDIVKRTFPTAKIEIFPDLAGIERVVCFRPAA